MSGAVFSTWPGRRESRCQRAFRASLPFPSPSLPPAQSGPRPPAGPVFLALEPVQRRPRAHGSHPRWVGRFLAKTLAKRGCTPTTRHPCRVSTLASWLTPIPGCPLPVLFPRSNLKSRAIRLRKPRLPSPILDLVTSVFLFFLACLIVLFRRPRHFSSSTLFQASAVLAHQSTRITKGRGRKEPISTTIQTLVQPPGCPNPLRFTIAQSNGNCRPEPNRHTNRRALPPASRLLAGNHLRECAASRCDT